MTKRKTHSHGIFGFYYFHLSSVIRQHKIKLFKFKIKPLSGNKYSIAIVLDFNQSNFVNQSIDVRPIYLLDLDQNKGSN